MPQGVDVSHYSGSINWTDVAKQGISFAFIKATEGIDWIDPTFKTNWEGAKQAGLIRGAYHFFVMDDDPQTQADWFVNSIGPLNSYELPPVVDVEQSTTMSPEAFATKLKTFLAAVESKTGLKPMIYTDPNWWNKHGTDDFGAYPLWIADYNVGEPTIPTGWNTWTFWQFKGDQSVTGIGADVDLNLFRGTKEGLGQLN